VTEELERALTWCLEAIEQEMLTIEECLERYPHHREELQRLLRAAMVIRQAPSVQPSAAFESHARNRLQAKLKPHDVAHASSAVRIDESRLTNRRKGFFRGGFVPRLATAALLLLIVVGGGISVAYAAGGAAPGDFLYRFDTAMEAVQLAFAPDKGRRARIELQFADERLEEIVQLITRGGPPENVQIAANSYGQTVQAASKDLAALAAAGESEEVSDLALIFYESLSVHGQVLEELKHEVPDSARSAIDLAQSVSEQGKAVVEALLVQGVPGGPPTDLAPDGLITPPPMESNSPGQADDQETEAVPTPPAVPGATEVPSGPTVAPNPTPPDIPTHPGQPTRPNPS